MPEDAVQVGSLQRHDLLAGEGQEAGGELGGPVGGLQDLAELVLMIGGEERVGLQHVAEPHDHHEDVVEVVGDPTRQLPDRLHLLRLQELLLQAPAVGDVFGNAEQVAGASLPVKERDLLGVQDAQLAGPGFNRLLGDLDQLPLLQGEPVLGTEELRLFPGKEVEIVFAEQLFPGIAEQVLAGLVEGDVTQVGRLLGEDHGRYVVDHVFQVVLGASERLLPLQPLADVPPHRQHVVPLPKAHPVQGDFRREDRAVISAQSADRHRLSSVGNRGGADQFPGDLAPAEVGNVPEGAGQKLLAAPPGLPAGGVVQVDDASAWDLHEKHGVVTVVEKGLEALQFFDPLLQLGVVGLAGRKFAETGELGAQSDQVLGLRAPLHRPPRCRAWTGGAGWSPCRGPSVHGR